MNKLVLGTVQFGMDYGISNQRGKIPENEVFSILDIAAEAGIDTLDTARTYGDSELVIGRYLKQSGKSFNVISKLAKCTPADADRYLSESLEKLGVDSIHALLMHDYNSFKTNPDLLEWLRIHKQAGHFAKYGFSLYRPQELEELLDNNVPFDIVQFPYSVFDRRFEPLLSLLKSRGIEVHVRSVFLQGLPFKPLSAVGDDFGALKLKLARLQEISKAQSVSPLSICLNFVLNNNAVDYVVFGIESVSNLREILAASADGAKVNKFNLDLDSLREDNEMLILPTNWSAIK